MDEQKIVVANLKPLMNDPSGIMSEQKTVMTVDGPVNLPPGLPMKDTSRPSSSGRQDMHPQQNRLSMQGTSNQNMPRGHETSGKTRPMPARKESVRYEDDRRQDAMVIDPESNHSRQHQSGLSEMTTASLTNLTKDKPLKKTVRKDDGRDQRSKNSGISMLKSVGRMITGLPGGYPDDGQEDLYYGSNHSSHKHHYGYDEPEPRSRSEDSLFRELDQLRQENASLKDNLREEQQKVGKFIKSADRMQKTMDNKELFLGGQASDEEVQGEFRALLNQIRTWASKLEQGPALTRRNLEESVADEFEAVAPGCLAENSTFWQSGKKSRMLIRGWVGLVVTKTIFRARSNIINDHNDALDRWMGKKVSKAVEAIEDIFAYDLKAKQPKVSMRNLHDWRALTIELLSRINLGSEAAKDLDAFIEDQGRKMMGVIEQFVLDKDKNDVVKGIMQILHSAVLLSKFLRRQRAYWWVVGSLATQTRSIETSNPQLPTWRPFDPVWMKDDYAEDDEDDEDNTHRKLVGLFLAPGLLKRGNIDGEAYEHTTCVVPILVTCL